MRKAREERKERLRIEKENKRAEELLREKAVEIARKNREDQEKKERA